jgi:hypothetical protein
MHQRYACAGYRDGQRTEQTWRHDHGFLIPDVQIIDVLLRGARSATQIFLIPMRKLMCASKPIVY